MRKFKHKTENGLTATLENGKFALILDDEVISIVSERAFIESDWNEIPVVDFVENEWLYFYYEGSYGICRYNAMFNADEEGGSNIFIEAIEYYRISNTNSNVLFSNSNFDVLYYDTYNIPLKYVKKANVAEIEHVLSKVAEKKGFFNGVKYTSTNKSGNTFHRTYRAPLKYIENMDCLSDSESCIIYSDNLIDKWATVLTKTTKVDDTNNSSLVENKKTYNKEQMLSFAETCMLKLLSKSDELGMNEISDEDLNRIKTVINSFKK